MIIDSNIANKFGASLADEARVVVYDHLMFIVQASVQKDMVLIFHPL